MNHCHYLLLAAAILCAKMLAAPVPQAQDSGNKPKDPVKVPQLLLDIYECWNKGGDHDHCLNFPAPSNKVNAVKSFIGDYEEKPLQAVQSNNLRDGEPMETLAFSFDTLAFPSDIVYTAFVRVNRKPLLAEEVESLDCDHSNLKMELYSTKSETSDTQEIMTLEKSVELPSANLDNSEWIDFFNLTSLVEEARATNSLLNFRLAIGGDCARVSPTKFGVSLEDHPELITYCNSKEESMFPALINEEVQRRKRQALNSGSGEEPSRNLESRRPVTLDEIKLAQCQIHDFNVSFADFGWDQYILQPASYNARFCGGRCNWPIRETHNTTRHSYIQAIVNFGNPKEVPPPCCAPKPDTLGALNVVLKDVNGTFVTRWWDEMIATNCACL